MYNELNALIGLENTIDDYASDVEDMRSRVRELENLVKILQEKLEKVEEKTGLRIKIDPKNDWHDTKRVRLYRKEQICDLRASLVEQLIKEGKLVNCDLYDTKRLVENTDWASDFDTDSEDEYSICRKRPLHRNLECMKMFDIIHNAAVEVEKKNARKSTLTIKKEIYVEKDLKKPSYDSIFNFPKNLKKRKYSQ